MALSRPSAMLLYSRWLMVIWWVIFNWVLYLLVINNKQYMWFTKNKWYFCYGSHNHSSAVSSYHTHRLKQNCAGTTFEIQENTSSVKHLILCLNLYCWSTKDVYRQPKNGVHYLLTSRPVCLSISLDWLTCLISTLLAKMMVALGPWALQVSRSGLRK